MSFTAGDLRWIKKHTEKQMKEYNMGKRLVDVLDSSNNTRSKVISKLKKLILVIGPNNKEDWEFVDTLTLSIVRDGAIPTDIELKHCNKLWRKYNVK
mgnify:CR=1 FL=1